MNLNIREKLREYRRVMSIARKPGKDEFIAVSKVSMLGIAVIGFIGFAIFLVFILTGI